MKKFKTAEERRAKALNILAKKGFLPKCKNCDEPDNRKAENGLCSKCNVEAERIEKEMQAKQEREERKQKLYKDRRGMWG